jgi:hypothetical protein
VIDAQQAYALPLGELAQISICNGCLRPLDTRDETTVAIGNFHFHASCAPACVACGRPLRPNTVRRATEYQVLDSRVEFVPNLGYHVALKVCCCGDCYDGMLHDEPSALA